MSRQTTRTSQQGHSSSGTPAANYGTELCEIVNVTVGADGRAGPYYVGDAKAVMTVCTGNCKFQMRGNGGDGPATSVYRDLSMSAEVQTGTSTKVGVINGDAMPYEFYLFDTSGSSNPVTMYVTY